LTLYFDLSISCVCNRNAEYKACVRNQSGELKNLYSVETTQKSKCERPNEIKSNKQLKLVMSNVIV